MSYPDAFKLDVPRTALVITDPQIDFLSPQGATWSVVGQSVESNNTVQNIERLLHGARQANMVVAISPHYRGGDAVRPGRLPGRPHQLTLHRQRVVEHR